MQLCDYDTHSDQSWNVSQMNLSNCNYNINEFVMYNVLGPKKTSWRHTVAHTFSLSPTFSPGPNWKFILASVAKGLWCNTSNPNASHFWGLNPFGNNNQLDSRPEIALENVVYKLPMSIPPEALPLESPFPYVIYNLVCFLIIIVAVFTSTIYSIHQLPCISTTDSSSDTDGFFPHNIWPSMSTGV